MDAGAISLAGEELTGKRLVEFIRRGICPPFSITWMLLVYFPLAHMIWGADGMMNGVPIHTPPFKSIDFAGGMVVHMSSGWSALCLCLILGKRIGFGKETMAPHNMVSVHGRHRHAVGRLVRIQRWQRSGGRHGFRQRVRQYNAGRGGWFDFLGSAGAAHARQAERARDVFGRGGRACHDYSRQRIRDGEWRGADRALPGVSTFFACSKLKAKFGYDDSLDTFGVHAVGGTVGTLLTGFLATTEANPNLSTYLGGVGRTDAVGAPVNRHGDYLALVHRRNRGDCLHDETMA